MKKILVYLLFLILIIFLIPILFTNKKVKTVVAEREENIVNNIEPIVFDYNYQDYKTIKLLHEKTNERQEINLDEYLLGVVSAEMPASFEVEALKAQAVVARTYTVYKIAHNNNKHGEADICDSANCCQAWISKDNRFEKWNENERENNWNKIVDSVNKTQGKLITYNGEPINAFFHSNSAGKTEAPINVWGGSGYPYLQTVETAGEDAYSGYSSEVVLKKQELEEKMKTKNNDFSIDYNNEPIKILEYTEGGRIKTLKIGNTEMSGVEARTLFGLRSANFEVNIEQDTIKFTVKGYGHGVGMSQTGADSMAKEGKNYEEIIKHFYTGVEIKDFS